MWNKHIFFTLSLLICVNFIASQSPPTNSIRRTEYDQQGKLAYFPKAVNGTVVRKDEFISFVSIQTKDGKHICGGMLLDVDFVVTSASCMSKISPQQQYETSELQVMNDAVNETVKNVRRIFIHPNYNSNTLVNDIAVLNIEAFKWVPEMEMLTAIDTPENDSVCQVIGWGQADGDEPFLQKIDVKLKDHSECSKEYRYENANKLCIEGNQGSCLEEPGSGLVCGGEIAGILSFGRGCDYKKSKPNVFVDISKYNIWIDEAFRTSITEDQEQQQTSSTAANDPRISDSPTTPRITTTVRTISITDPTSTIRNTFSTTTPRSTSRLPAVIPVAGSQPPSGSSSPGQETGHWSYNVVLDTCQLPFTTCTPVWTSHSYNIVCKRGFFPYGCFHVVKVFVKEEPAATAKHDISDEERLENFIVYLKRKPIKVLESVANLIVESRSDAVRKTPHHPPNQRFNHHHGHPQFHAKEPGWNYNDWFQRAFCYHAITTQRFNQMAGLPWNTNILGCEQYVPGHENSLQQRGQFDSPSTTTMDSRIYFPNY